MLQVREEEILRKARSKVLGKAEAEKKEETKE